MKSALVIWVGRIIFGLFVIFLIISAIAYFAKPGNPPSIDKASWVIQTYSNDEFKMPSRIYYAESLEYIDGVPVAKGKWWSFDGRSYHQHKGDKPFPVEEYGKVDIIKRIKTEAK